VATRQLATSSSVSHEFVSRSRLGQRRQAVRLVANPVAVRFIRLLLDAIDESEETVPDGIDARNKKLSLLLDLAALIG
jgi:hypothetical protein